MVVLDYKELVRITDGVKNHFNNVDIQNSIPLHVQKDIMLKSLQENFGIF